MKLQCPAIQDSKKITNHSVRKHLMQKCNDIGLAPTHHRRQDKKTCFCQKLDIYYERCRFTETLLNDEVGNQIDTYIKDYNEGVQYVMKTHS